MSQESPNLGRPTSNAEGRREDAEPAAPWYVRALLGASAWLAAILLLPLLGWLLRDSLDASKGASLLVAAVCCVVAAPLLRRRGSGFLQQCGAALSLAGLLFAVISGSWPGWPHWLVIGGMAAVMYAAAPVLVHRYLCAVVLLAATVMLVPDMAGTLMNQGAAVLAAGGTAGVYWVMRTRAGLAMRVGGLEPIGVVFALASIVLAWDLDGGVPLWLCAGWPATAWLCFSRSVADVSGAWRRYRLTLAAILLLLAPAWLAAPGLAIGLGWLIAGFALRRLLLLGGGAGGMLVYLAVYYYQLDTSLLQKALWLGVTGLALAGFALFASRHERAIR